MKEIKNPHPDTRHLNTSSEKFFERLAIIRETKELSFAEKIYLNQFALIEHSLESCDNFDDVLKKVLKLKEKSNEISKGNN